MDYIERPECMEWLERWREKDVIKVVSGVRRCGKSTALAMFRARLSDSGVPKERIVSINFEDVSYEPLTDYHALHEHILERLAPDATTYVLLDEVQHVEHFERALDSLHARGGCDIYVTGSNAYLMASELATLLTGRYVELKMLPLSYAEFFEGARRGNAELGREEAFDQYLSIGSFPYLVQLLDDGRTAREYLSDVYASILLKDVVQRLGVSDVSVLERLAQLLASSVGSLVSTGKVASTLRSQGRRTDQKTVDKYLDGLVGSQLFYEVPRWDVKGRRLLARNAKFYIVDTGLRHALVAGSSRDLEHLLENVVYLELRRRGYEVYVGSLQDGEIDFVATLDGRTSYYQVAATVMDPSTLERELSSLRRARDDRPKAVLTLDRVIASPDIEGIRVLNVLDWLLGDCS